jgi:bisphosphoglycerate-independent phosphoglycerate mutase (AlkP superfamily)
MVGHTGSLTPPSAVEVLDECLGRVLRCGENVAFITATTATSRSFDPSTGNPTPLTTDLVPFIAVARM